jgi:predicted nuclease of predicted toxin-antitoxin system
MRIKLDENLPAELAEDLHRLGHLVDTVADEGLNGLPDPLVADAARSTMPFLFGQGPG